MKALCWEGINKLKVENVPDPQIRDPRDAIIRVKLSSACGSDLHIIDGLIPTVRHGEILGHEFIGEVVEIGKDVRKLKKGDRVAVAAIIGCGGCYFCQHDQWPLCDNANPADVPNAPQAFQEKVLGQEVGGVYGYTYALGGFTGSHAEYIRVPFADHGAFVLPDEISDEQAVLLTDAAPTGYTGASLCDIRPGDTVVVWGCGGVGQMAIQSANLLGAERVIAIDRVPERLQMARDYGHAETLNYEQVDIPGALLEMTGGRGPDACIDAVGMEGHGTGISYAYDRVKQALRMETDRAQALRQAIHCCAKGGRLSVVGVYGLADKFPFGVLMHKSLTLKASGAYAQKYIPTLIDLVRQGKLDPSYILTHTMSLEEGPHGYSLFKEKKEGCVRVAFDPQREAA
ncbi:MAG: zinc-dependent alcohol dehydrogenase [Bdellovibrionia bacterium]